MATSHKTYNAALGTDSAGHQFRSIMHDARAHGKATGMVVGCGLTDATPAAFAIMCPNRNAHEAIATKYLAAPIDFMYAGGLQYFTQRQDHQNLLTAWQRQGYQVAAALTEAAAPGGPKPVAECTAACSTLPAIGTLPSWCPCLPTGPAASFLPACTRARTSTSASKRCWAGRSD
jgi:hypothetical protein